MAATHHPRLQPACCSRCDCSFLFASKSLLHVVADEAIWLVSASSACGVTACCVRRALPASLTHPRRRRCCHAGTSAQDDESAAFLCVASCLRIASSLHSTLTRCRRVCVSCGVGGVVTCSYKPHTIALLFGSIALVSYAALTRSQPGETVNNVLYGVTACFAFVVVIRWGTLRAAARRRRPSVASPPFRSPIAVASVPLTVPHCVCVAICAAFSRHQMVPFPDLIRPYGGWYSVCQYVSSAFYSWYERARSVYRCVTRIVQPLRTLPLTARVRCAACRWR